jgi:acyl-CoA dehydrogenase
VTLDFSLDARVTDWRDRIAEFVAEVVIPCEQDAFANGVDDALRRELQAAARKAGVWAPQARADLGGGGFRFHHVAAFG